MYLATDIDGQKQFRVCVRIVELDWCARVAAPQKIAHQPNKMLQPRILVDSSPNHKLSLTKNLSISTKTNNKVNTGNTMWSCNKTKNSISATSNNSNNTTTITTTTAATAANRLTARCARKNSSNGCGSQQRNYSAAMALNVTSSIHNLATFIILAVTLYSTTLCMAQLSGEYRKQAHALFSFLRTLFSISL